MSASFANYGMCRSSRFASASAIRNFIICCCGCCGGAGGNQVANGGMLGCVSHGVASEHSAPVVRIVSSFGVACGGLWSVRSDTL